MGERNYTSRNRDNEPEEKYLYFLRKLAQNKLFPLTTPEDTKPADKIINELNTAGSEAEIIAIVEKHGKEHGISLSTEDMVTTRKFVSDAIESDAMTAPDISM